MAPASTRSCAGVSRPPAWNGSWRTSPSRAPLWAAVASTKGATSSGSWPTRSLGTICTVRCIPAERNRKKTSSRAFAGVDRSLLDPFVHMDQMGEVDYAPGEPRGTDWHPHRGFETVTYIIDGTFVHQDSHGGGGVISDGARQGVT